MMAVHERLHQQAARLVRGIERALDLVRPFVHRLLAEDMFAGLERADRPLDVQRVRQRVVDHLDLVVLEQRLVAAVRARELVLLRVLVGARLVAAGDGDDLRRVRPRGTGEDRLVDPRRREQSPANGLHLRIIYAPQDERGRLDRA
jgi:hypothetical protein